MQDGPKGLGWGTVHDLEAAGLIVQSGDATSIRGRPFRTTDAGRALLATPDPASGLPKMMLWEFPEDGGDPVRVPSGTTAEEANAPREAALRRPAASRPPSRDRMRTDRLAYPPRGLGRIEAARYVGISTSKFDEMVRDGRMPHPKRIDVRKVWDRHALDESFENLPTDEEKIDEGRWQVDL